MRVRPTLLTFMIGLLLCSTPESAHGQDAGDVATLRRLEDQRRIAYARFDTVLLAPILAPDYRVVAPGTFKTQDRAAALRVIKIMEPTHVPIRAIEWDTLDIRVLGDLAVTRGRLRHVMAPRDGSPDFTWTDNFLHLWIRREGHWQLLERQGFREPQDP